jgi:tyrosine-specific transport protein
MIAFARLILEACTWVPRNANLITITHHLLGPTGAAACWILYLFLFYCLMTAHVAAGGGAIAELTQQLIPNWLSTLIYVFVFAPVVCLGTKSVDRVNIALMIGVLVTYLFFVAVAIPHVNYQFIERNNWNAIWPSFSVILTAFGFQNLIPTLYTYLDGDHKLARKAIWIGTAIPLILYLIWEFLVLGVVPLFDLEIALKEGQSAVIPLQNTLNNTLFSHIAQAFALFAMTTSFIGISIAFIDFWADGLRLEKRGAKRAVLATLVFLIPLVFVFFNPKIFIDALTLAGGLGMILLLGVLPILCVWSGRYVHRHSLSHQFIPGGKLGLIILMIFCLFVLIRQLLY